MKKLNRILLAGICALAMSTGVFARSSVPLMNLVDVQVVSPKEKPLTAEQVKAAVLFALGAKGWVAQQAEGNGIKATYAKSGHSATINVTYSEKSYSIQYLGSENLNYAQGRRGGQTIHPTYNSWIAHLKTSIDTSLRTGKESTQ